MPDLLLHAEPYGSLLRDAEVPCIIISWHGFANSAQFRFLMNHGLELYAAEAVRTQPLGWLADTRGLSAVKLADQDWLKDDWNHRAAAAGIRHVGFVVPESVFGQITVQNYSTNAANATQYHIVPLQHRTVAEAKAWLKKVIHQPLTADS